MYHPKEEIAIDDDTCHRENSKPFPCLLRRKGGESLGHVMIYMHLHLVAVHIYVLCNSQRVSWLYIYIKKSLGPE